MVPNEVVFSENSPAFISGKNLAKRLIALGDHLNGINNDNRLPNLRFLCPNCHSQTPTYGNRRRCGVLYSGCCERGEMADARRLGRRG